MAAVFGVALVVLSYQYFTTMYHQAELDRPRGDGTYRPLLAVQDGHKIYLQVMSAVLDGELDISDEVEQFGYAGYRWKTDSGRLVYPHAIGPVIAWAPAFAVAHGASKVANVFGADIEGHGYTLFHQRVVYFTCVLFAWLTALIGYRAARRLMGGTWIPALAALGILFGTNLSYYAVNRPDYGHALSAFVCALFLSRWLATVGQLGWRRFAVLGALLGAAALVRTASIFLGVVVAIELAVLLARSPAGRRLLDARDLAARGAVALGAALLVFCVQVLVWKVHYDSGWFQPPHGTAYVHLGRPMLNEFLFSSHNGFLSTHPLAYAAIFGLVLAPRKIRLVGLGLLAAVALTAYVNSCVYDWWAMASYGARRMCCISFALIIGLAALMAAANRVVARAPVWSRRALAVAVVSWFVVWNQSYFDPARKRVRSLPLSMCCDEVPGFMASVAEPVYDRVGNPFALPGSWLWSRRWGVSIKRFDEIAIGAYAARPTGTELEFGQVTGKLYVWNIPGVNFPLWIVRGFGLRQSYIDTGAANKRRYFRWTTQEAGAIFVPLFLPNDHLFELPMRPNIGPNDPPMRVRLRWNREHIVFDGELRAGWSDVKFRVGARWIERGTNMLEIIGTATPFRATGPPKTYGLRGDRRHPIAVAVRQMKIWIEEPTR